MIIGDGIFFSKQIFNDVYIMSLVAISLNMTIVYERVILIILLLKTRKI